MERCSTHSTLSTRRSRISKRDIVFSVDLDPPSYQRRARQCNNTNLRIHFYHGARRSLASYLHCAYDAKSLRPWTPTRNVHPLDSLKRNHNCSACRWPTRSTRWRRQARTMYD